MTFLAFFGHLLNFAAPAAGMALLMWGLPRLWPWARKSRWSTRKELPILFGLGVAVLLAGLVVFGRDGKMLSYAALVVVLGTQAWWVRGR